MKKRILAILLVLSLVVACIPAASAYSNVAPWAKESVDSMYQLGFLPQSLNSADMTRRITRGEMCKIAVAVFNQLMGTPDVGPHSTDHFDDTSDPDICYAFEQGIVSGYGNGKFGPNEPLTRQDFIKITFNMMCTAYWNPTVVTPDPLTAFGDSDKISEYARTATGYLVALGIVKGSDGSMKPLAYTSCQEAITMFFRAYQYLENWMRQQNEESKTIEILNQGYYGISTWAILEVQEMQKRGMIPDCLNNCNMASPITRAQMCSIAVLAYEKVTGKEYTPSGTHFKDTDNPDVNAAYELGIVDGYGNGRFGPNDTLTREQFFKIMANFMKTIGYPREDSRAVSLGQYKDGSSVASWAQAPARVMIYIGAVRGDGKNLNPKNPTTIEEAIAIFLRCFKYTTVWIEEHPDGEESMTEYEALISDLVAFARSFEGYPYVYGGNGPNSFDCSGFVLYVYKHFGYSFSRGAQEQYGDGIKVTKEELLPGDLVFFSGNGYYITHVGLYLGQGQFIHASNPTRGVVIDTLWSGYYSSHYWGGCRIIVE
ncbi:MAG: S-layer homology domain-containing protein [Oscillospiraceae bacterium]|nr:S-layer homology domain-containing protein [Oscillospiraceae bacterium]